MNIDHVSVHIGLAVILFYSLNWVGKHSESVGYVSLTALEQRDTAPAFNIIFRVLGPNVFVILSAWVCYYLDFNKYVEEIWTVVPLYYLIRIGYQIAFNRFRLLNLKREVTFLVLSTFLAWLLYSSLISHHDVLIPKAEDLKNQFWILVFLFLYSIANSIEVNHQGSYKRKRNFVKKIFEQTRKKYGSIVDTYKVDELCESIIYSILVFEQYNRPPLFRFVEHLLFPWFSKTLGPMQVKTSKRISDNQSVAIGCQLLARAYRDNFRMAILKAFESNSRFQPIAVELHAEYLVNKVAASYTRDDDYVDGVREVYDQLLDLYYKPYRLKETYDYDRIYFDPRYS